jgi:hypothetical protein
MPAKGKSGLNCTSTPPRLHGMQRDKFTVAVTSFGVLHECIVVQQQKTVSVSLVPPYMVSVHLCVVCPPRLYDKIQL